MECFVNMRDIDHRFGSDGEVYSPEKKSGLQETQA